MQFLLGDLAEEKRSAFEDRLFADGDLFDRVLVAEADLVDSYVRGELSERDRRRLEAGLLATPAGRERLAFARALDMRIRGNQVEPARTVERARTSPWRGIGAWLFERRVWVAGAAAAAVAIAVAAVWYLDEPDTLLLGDPDRAAVETRPAPQPPPERGPEEGATGSIPTPPPTTAIAPPRRPAQPKPSTPRRAPRAPVVAFEFAPQTVRGVEELRVLSVPEGVETVRLVLRLSEPERSRYSAVLTTAAGEAVLRRDALPLRGAGSDRHLVLDIPAGRLGAEEYVVALTEPGDATRTVADFIFRVERQ